MGLFGKKETCCICGENEGSKKLMDGMICKECMKKIEVFSLFIDLKSTSKNKIMEAIRESENNNELLQKFSPSKTIEEMLYIDEVNKLWKPIFPSVVFHYSDVISFELIEDGESITKGGVGQAVAGGMLFGDVGAIVGGVTGTRKTKKVINKLNLKIITRHPILSDIHLAFLPMGSVKTGSSAYKGCIYKAQKCMSELARMIDETEANSQNKTQQVSSADEILKYKQLLDCGAITQEEFDAKKQQLLGV